MAHGGGHVAGYRALVQAVQSRLERATAANSTARDARARQLEAEARRAAEEAARKAAEPPRSSSGSESGPSTYTGCRSYAPGGKTWTPIPC